MTTNVLIIGAGSDIARSIAEKYASLGFDIMLTARRPDELERVAKDLSVRYEIKAKTYELDVLNYSKHESFFESLERMPEIIVCAAGYLGSQEKAEKDPKEARLIMETNYNGCAALLDIAARHLEEKGSGTIIGISSVAGDRGRPSNYFYGSSKAAFSEYLAGLRARLFKKGVHVLTVKPGFVQTKMTEDMNLPPLLTASPGKVANAVINSARKKRNTIYVKWFWRYIMIIIFLIPEPVFKRLKL